MILDFFASLIQYGVNLILQIISTSGYIGILVLMILESAVMPVPSEVVMPFAGYLAWAGQFDIWLVTLAGTVGNLIGSLLAYVIGLFFGRKFILKYGKYVLLKEKYLLLTEKWFKKYGDKAIFFSRLLPVVRTVISLPAGIGRMNFNKFIVYTFIGSIPWNFALTYAGFWLGKNWEGVVGYTHKISIIVILVLFSVLAWHIWSHRRNNRRERLGKE